MRASVGPRRNPASADRTDKTTRRTSGLLLVGLLATSLGAAGCRSQSSERVSNGSPRLVETELKSEVFGNTRALRVLLPPSYDDPASGSRRYPVFYFTDGVAAFDAWGLPDVAAGLWREKEIPEFIFVGIDNGGSTAESTDPARDRASEYLPYPDRSWAESPPPEPRGQRFPAFLFEEVMPLVDRRFRTETGGPNTGLAGASHGGIAALYTAMKYPDRIGYLLVESPPLHVGGGRLLRDASTAVQWPARVYLGVGTAEADDAEGRTEIVENVRALQAAVERGSGATAVHFEVEQGGVHWYSSWRARLPTALEFLLTGLGSELRFSFAGG